MKARAKVHLSHGLTGLLLGAALSFIGFADFGEVHRMFRFQDFRLFGVFAGAVGLSGIAFVAMRSRGIPAKKAMHRGVIPGAVLFGAGWALCGACPAIAMVQLGEAKLPAAFTLAGILSGTWLYGKVHARLFRWDSGSCES